MDIRQNKPLLHHATISCVRIHYVSHADNYEELRIMTEHAMMYTCMLANVTCAIAARRRAGMAPNPHKTRNRI